MDQEKLEKIIELYTKIDDRIFTKFFDITSVKMLDEKISVMEDLLSGKKPIEIKNYYKVLELMPEDKNDIWD